MELLYEGEFETEDDLHRMEGEYQRKIDCVNKRIEGRTDKEYNHQYHLDNKDKIKQYYQDNKNKIKERVSVKFKCPCGVEIQRCEKARHNKSKKHQAYLSTL
jgi:predicted RNA-binding Zn-ribbon protein involved in translation (DUF1610 family)